MPNIYLVISERDGNTTKVPGTKSTELIRIERRYLADSINQVIEVSTELIAGLLDEDFKAIVLEHENIIILSEPELL